MIALCGELFTNLGGLGVRVATVLVSANCPCGGGNRPYLGQYLTSLREARGRQPAKFTHTFHAACLLYHTSIG